MTEPHDDAAPEPLEPPRTAEPAVPAAGSLAPAGSRDEPDDPDDLAGFSSPMTRLVASARSWLALLVAAALVVPAAAWLVDEFAFRRSAEAVVATLEGERSGADAAETVLLVRSVGCDGRASSGTAFVVDTEDGPALLTNRHVVASARTVGVRALDGSTDVRVAGVRTSASADVAVLEVADAEALPPALELATTPPAAGDVVRLIGFPAATPFTDAGAIGEVVGPRLLLEVEVAPGASGSPVVGEDGRVVGQVFAVTDDGLGVATPASELPTAIADAEPEPGC